jgi:hypothetical protein
LVFPKNRGGGGERAGVITLIAGRRRGFETKKRGEGKGV